MYYEQSFSTAQRSYDQMQPDDQETDLDELVEMFEAQESCTDYSEPRLDNPPAEPDAELAEAIAQGAEPLLHIDIAYAQNGFFTVAATRSNARKIFECMKRNKEVKNICITESGTPEDTILAGMYREQLANGKTIRHVISGWTGEESECLFFE